MKEVEKLLVSSHKDVEDSAKAIEEHDNNLVMKAPSTIGDESSLTSCINTTGPAIGISDTMPTPQVTDKIDIDTKKATSVEPFNIDAKKAMPVEPVVDTNITNLHIGKWKRRAKAADVIAMEDKAEVGETNKKLNLQPPNAGGAQLGKRVGN
jgi:hypothetical protein